MVKDLFKDLKKVDVSDKYLQKNIEFERKVRIQELDFEILLLEEKERTKNWARSVISFYDKQADESKDILMDLENLDKFKLLKQEAEKLLEEEILNEKRLKQLELERIEKAKQKELELQRIEKEKIDRTVKKIDESILKLIKGTRNKFWCEEVDRLYLEVGEVDVNVRKMCQNLYKLDELRKETDSVFKALEFDKKIKTLQMGQEPNDRIWCEEVCKCFKMIDDGLIPYMKNMGDLRSLYVTAIDALKEIEKKEEKQRRIELANKEKLEKEKKEEELKQIEQRAKDYIISEEKRIKIEKELKDRQATVERATKELDKMGYNYKIENNKIILYRYKYSQKPKVVVIPEGVDEIGKDAFNEDDKFGGKNVLEKIVLPSTITKIGDRAFYNCRKLKEVNFPSPLKEIGEFAFAYCYKIKKVKLPDSIKEIKQNTFNFCKSIVEVSANGVGRIASHGFANCKKLKSVTMKKLESVGWYGFAWCKKLKSIKSNYTIKSSSFNPSFAGCKHLNKATRDIILNLT